MQTALPRKALGHRVAADLPTLLGSTASPSGCKREKRPQALCVDRFIHSEEGSDDPATPDMSPSSMLDAALDKSQNLLDEILALNLDDKPRMRAHISCANFHEVTSEQQPACVPPVPPLQMPLQGPDNSSLMCTEMLEDVGKKSQCDEDSLSTC